MRVRRKTIRRTVSLAGRGIHTGERCEMVLAPAPGKGIVFRKAGASPAEAVPLSPETFRPGARCSVIEGGGFAFATVEHLLSVFFVHAVTDVEVLLDGPELPAAGGSAAEFLDLVERAGLVEADAVEPLILECPAHVEEGDARLSAFPWKAGLRISYTLDLSSHGVPVQSVAFDVTPESFAASIAPARTFVPAALVEPLRAAGFGKGADAANTFVPGDPAYPERFPYEAAAHKVLDLLGDLCPLGRPLHARIEAVGSGHALNNRLLRKLLEVTS